jgi:hypothetical protein
MDRALAEVLLESMASEKSASRKWCGRTRRGASGQARAD